MSEARFIGRALCTDCDACLRPAAQCQPQDARQMSVAEVLALLRRYGPRCSPASPSPAGGDRPSCPS